MSCTLRVAWDDRLAGYDFGAGHPMASARVELTIELARALGVFSAPGVPVERPEPAIDTDLETVHQQRSFRPEILVSQHGCDTHSLDPLADLELSIDAQRVAHAATHRLAHEVADGRWLLTGGGGDEPLQVVSRTWTHLLAEAAGRPIDPRMPIPPAWREYAARRTGQEAPQTMTDGAEPTFTRFECGFNPADPVDRAIFATRAAVFPEHGLMPEP